MYQVALPRYFFICGSLSSLLHPLFFGEVKLLDDSHSCDDLVLRFLFEAIFIVLSAISSTTSTCSDRNTWSLTPSRSQILPVTKKWLNNMSEPAEDEPIVIHNRQARLGPGATVPRSPKLVPSDDPLERKLHSKLVAGRNAAKTAEESTLVAGDDDEDDDEDSRTRAFKRKRPAVPVNPSFQAKTKKK